MTEGIKLQDLSVAVELNEKYDGANLVHFRPDIITTVEPNSFWLSDISCVMWVGSVPRKGDGVSINVGETSIEAQVVSVMYIFSPLSEPREHFEVLLGAGRFRFYHKNGDCDD